MKELDPVALKLIHSTQSAIPFDLTFWERLAHGLFISPEELAKRTKLLTDEGILIGWHGELNPDLTEAREAIFTGPPHDGWPLLRWTATSTTQAIQSAMILGEAPNSGWTATRCAKSWGRLRPEARTGFDLLAPDTDRTTRTLGAEPPGLSIGNDLDAQVAQALLQTRPLAYPGTPWGELAAITGAAPADVIQSAKRLVATRILRRIAFRYSPRALGFAGCAFAAWRLDSQNDLTGAAEAIAALAGIADVFERQPDAKTGANLSCLFLGREVGSGADAARSIASQWGTHTAFIHEVELA